MQRVCFSRKREAAEKDANKRGEPPSAFLFPGAAGKPQAALKKFWASTCKTAKIDGVRIHDLRHTYASVLASAGQSLPVIGALLGHSNPQTTARYAHLFDDPLRVATERASSIIAPRPKRHGKSADVIPTNKQSAKAKP